ncbi:MAG: hypothetical protein ACRC0B_03555 [Legionella sp.]
MPALKLTWSFNMQDKQEKVVNYDTVLDSELDALTRRNTVQNGSSTASHTYKPSVDTHTTDDYIEQMYLRAKAIAPDLQVKEAIQQIDQSFLDYLDRLNQDDYPLHPKMDALTNETPISEVDLRVIVYTNLLRTVLSNNLPTHDQGHELMFQSLGWPVAPELKHYRDWRRFGNQAKEIIERLMPETNLNLWADGQLPPGDTYAYISRLSQKKIKSAKGEAAKQAIDTVTCLFVDYLDRIRQEDKVRNTADFPFLPLDAESNSLVQEELDKRVVVFYGLVHSLSKNRNCFDANNANEFVDVGIKGWPVAADNIYSAHWLDFLNKAVSVVKKAIPSTVLGDLSHWTGNVFSQQYDILVDEGRRRSLAKYQFNGLESSPELDKIGKAISEMHAYGCSLKDKAPEKSLVVVELAIELFEDLKQFDKPADENKKHSLDAYKQFKDDFTKKLHSCDNTMSQHRAHWKAVVGNIAVALTGIGLVAIAISYAVYGCGFFETTKSQSLVNNVEEQTMKCLSK